jgi:hypothetical protein
MVPGGSPPCHQGRRRMSFCYVGSELELFSHAHRWKAYWGSVLRPYLGSRVLEVGAGIGANIPVLISNNVRDWVALEPDAGLAQRIERQVTCGALPAAVRLMVGTLQSSAHSQPYDTILYIDVLEHIIDDADELRRASGLLDSGGRLIVLAPAHQCLFSPFDEAIGHQRRYNRSSLGAIGPIGCHLKMMRELDCVGLFASLSNKLLLRQAVPTQKQIEAWDRFIVPISRRIDPLTGYLLGKSICAVWCRD